jgi:hypothetical protein
MALTQKMFDDLEKRIYDLEQEIRILKSKHDTSNSSINTDNSQVIIDIPKNMIEKIMALDESSQIPILWYYSTKPIMSVKEFLTVCAKKGFMLSHSWLPAAGGHFAGTFITKKKIFHEVKSDTKSKEKLWQLTDVAKFKISKIIAEMH